MQDKGRRAIVTCLKVDNPSDTNNRNMLWHHEQPDGILGWVVHKPGWGEGIFHVTACWRGIAWLVGYVEEAAQVWPTLKEWFVSKNNEEERHRDAAEDGV
jgi:hypothetical protein